MLVFVIFGVIDHRAVPGWAPMAIGAVVFAVIIILGPATGAAINPARYLGAVFMLKAFGGTVLWSQLPAYLIGEFVGGVLGGLAWVGDRQGPRGRGDDQPRARRPRPQHRQLGKSQWSHVMKKLINSPETVVTDALEGVAAAHPSLSVDVENKVITRAGGPHGRQGRPGVRRRFRPRAAARRLRRLRHARRRLPGRGVHLAGARPDARSRPRRSTAARACCTS